jgi:hypothetical protein
MWMEFHREIYGNPANPREAAVMKRLDSNAESDGKPLGGGQQHPITVGDVCFVIIGQITGRGYEAARYQPSGGMVINSPTGDPEIARAVREIWASADPTETVYHSLLVDHCSRGVRSQDYTKDTVGRASYLQTNSVMRLLYYFPRETAPIVAARLRSLDVRKTGPGGGSVHTPAELDQFLKREETNGVDTTEYIRAVNWCRIPEVRRELEAMFRRTGDPDVLVLTAKAVPSNEWPLVQNRFAELLRKQPRQERGWYGDGYNALVALRECGGRKALPLYRAYIKTGGAQRRFSVCEALRYTSGDWDRELLYPLLNDRRPADGYEYSVDEKRRSSIRVCDQAAEVIALHRKDLHFAMKGPYSELDRQIKELKRAH